MRYREVQVIVAVRDEVSTPKSHSTMGTHRMSFSDGALRRYAAAPDKAVSVVLDHVGDDEGKRVGHVKSWHYDGSALTATLRITALDLDVKVGDGVSLGVNHVSAPDPKTGFSRVSSIAAIREVSLLGRERGALRSSVVTAVGEVQGTHDDVPAGQLATAMKMAGMTPGFSTVTGTVASIK